MAITQVDMSGSSFGNRLGDLNRQWCSRSADERYLTIQELHDAVAKRTAEARTYDFDMKQLHFHAAEGEIRYTIGDQPSEFRFNDWSWGQMCSRLGGTLGDGVLPDGTGIPSSFLASLDPKIGADALNDVARRRRNNTATGSTYYDKNTRVTHSVTSTKFARIPDMDVARVAMEVMDRFHWSVPGVLNWRTGGYNTATPVTKKTTTLFASTRDVFICIVDHEHPIEVGKLKNGDPEIVYRGVIMRNSEVGGGKFEMKTFLFAAVCANRNIWGARNVQNTSIRHIGKAQQRFYDEAMPGFLEFVRGDAAGIRDGIKAAKERILIDVTTYKSAREQALAGIRVLTGLKIPEKRAEEIMKEGSLQLGYLPMSAWDFSQVISAGAQLAEFQDERFDMERKTEQLLKVAA